MFHVSLIGVGGIVFSVGIEGGLVEIVSVVDLSQNQYVSFHPLRKALKIEIGWVLGAVTGEEKGLSGLVGADLIAQILSDVYQILLHREPF